MSSCRDHTLRRFLSTRKLRTPFLARENVPRMFIISRLRGLDTALYSDGLDDQCESKSLRVLIVEWTESFKVVWNVVVRIYLYVKSLAF